MRAGYQEHAQIVTAIAARDADAAEQAMRAHIASTLARSRAG
jgi:DNA-binding GntR family transcriptional regulator